MFCATLTIVFLGPLHMSPVDRAASVSDRDLAWPLFSLLKYRCVHMRGRAGPVTEISVTGMNIISPYEQSSRGDRDEISYTNSFAFAT